MAKPGNIGIRRIMHATTYSTEGLRQAWRFEAAFRQEFVLTVILIPVAFWLGRSAMEVLLLIVCCLFVLVVELLNSAIETTVDRIGSEYHELSGRAKDIGSAAVFLSLCIVLIVWSTVAWQRFMA